MPRSLRSLPAALLLFMLASSLTRAEEDRAMHGPWIGVSLPRSSGFDTTVRDPSPLFAQDVRFDSGVGLGVRAGYDFEALVGAFVTAELLTGREDSFYTSFAGGLRVLTPTAPLRAGLTAGVRFIDSGPALPFFTTGVLGEARLGRHLGLLLEVDKSWPLKREITVDSETGDHPRSTTVVGGPWGLVLGLTWYF
ncbi:MAG: hypothetical protein EOO71_31090 [Myxococcaceae bacterium]|uniref:hypothetical protein n=1 Tax=Corallococcus sp. BB11-1 TaxID=2996783 RepID=UPI0010E6DB80|nr:hypothetical protein [Corallococcus sp. BB11-1]MCY1035105.1 hypothetical protein [Corallococcus sp. BB11-1]RYZ36622.1 MAG: hypothetical protein EOO71_31090 [Myxococcaceae bacterium]